MAKDTAGNTSPVSVPFAISVDTAAPVLSMLDLAASSDTGSSDIDDVTADAAPTFAFSAERNSTVAVDFGDGRGLIKLGIASGEQQFVSLDVPYDLEGIKTIQVRATDLAGNTSTRAMTLTVDLAPSQIILNQTAIDENSLAGTIVGGLAIVDGLQSSGHTLHLTDDANGRFSILGSNLVVADGAVLDFEAAQSHEISVSATDNAGHTLTENVIITLNDINESFVGGEGTDTVTGDAGDNTIDADAGDDIVSPGAGIDVITLGAGQDALLDDLANFDGDTVIDFTTEDSFVFRDSLIYGQNIQIDAGNGLAQLLIDANGNGSVDATINLNGDFGGGEVMSVHYNDQTVVTFETYLPVLAEGVALDASLVNGINNHTFLTGDGFTGYRLTLNGANMNSGFDNSFDVYEIGAKGNIVDVRIVIDNVKASANGQFDITGIEAEHELGFFLIQDGADWAAGHSLADEFVFTDGLGGPNATINSGRDTVLTVNGQNAGVTTFHSFPEALDVDGVAHALSGVNAGDQSITVGFEDMLGGGDRDFQDVIFTVEAFDL